MCGLSPEVTCVLTVTFGSPMLVETDGCTSADGGSSSLPLSVLV